ncbi:nitrate reductase [NADH] 2-like [Glycine soja]|uniref:Nitrate reductase n=1 Tax=Glycine soja TaxID=3848 RepID=A0A445H6X1_GLYSO|nr:nitrate reductase [NADH] 2-like [Glycine soja]RZB69349.1 Nitrate reductase [NADH] 2 [Glycine soja]
MAASTKNGDVSDCGGDLKPPLPLDFSSDEDDENDDVSYLNELIQKARTEIEDSVLDPHNEGIPDKWVPRIASLVRLTGKHPFNAEPPLPLLMHHGFITPAPLHYVRNHGPVPKANWEDWTVEVTGLVKRPNRFSMKNLVKDFHHREFPATLVCSGNRRKELNIMKPTSGSSNTAGSASTSVWRGIPLRHVLRRCGILARAKGALHVCFEGAEDLPGGGGSKYGTSISRDLAMDPTRDVILAYMQNGEHIPPDHGFPVRLIIPGFIGGRMVKWLKRIVVCEHESDNHYHYKDNKMLPSHVDADLANEEGWWYKQEYKINELSINSVITTPSHEEILSINSYTTQRPYELRGYAYSGAGRKVTRVEVTFDGGETWHVCTLDHTEKPNKYGKYWCWCFWSLEVEVIDLLGTNEIAVRAWDEGLNTQPEHLNWNLMGMMNNCWYRVKTNVGKPAKGEIGILFEHPAQPGNQPGGWMGKERHLEKSLEKLPSIKRSGSTPSMNITSKRFSISEVKKHCTSDSTWIIVHGHVYDCTRFLKDHPGGVDSILINAGTDCTEEFDAIHSDKARRLLEDFRIGELMTTDYTSDSEPDNSMHGDSESTHLAPIKEITTPRPQRKVALNSREKISCKLVSKTYISHNTRLFRFALPSEDQLLGLPVGKHIFLYATIGDKLCIRAYTPTSSVDEVGFFDLLIKVYFKGVHPKYPNGGLMSQHLDSLSIGSMLDVKGPLGHIEYTGRGNFMVHGKQKFAKRLAMLAGGTGITPIYQVAQAILKDPEDHTEMHLVYANHAEDDILLREELDAWAKTHCDRFKVWYVVGIAKEGWQYSVGRITESIMREHLPKSSSDALALTCGPPPMIEFAVQPNLEKMGYDIKNDLLVF